MGGTVTAATLVPRGCDICLMPMARPRRWRGNHPMTTRPLAEFTEAAAAPEAAMMRTIHTGEPTRATAMPRGQSRQGDAQGHGQAFAESDRRRHPRR